MKILAFDTSTQWGSVALLDESVENLILAEEKVYSQRTHTEKLLPMVDDLLRRVNGDFSDVDAYAVGRGPGSFTGIRISLATAQAFAFATQKRIIGISTLKAMAFGKKDYPGVICPLLPATRGEVYTALFRFGLEKEGEEILKETVIGEGVLLELLKEYHIKMAGPLPILLVGERQNFSENFLEEASFLRWEKEVIYPKASSIALLALEEIKKGDVFSHSGPSPSYLRLSQAEVNLMKRN